MSPTTSPTSPSNQTPQEEPETNPTDHKQKAPKLEPKCDVCTKKDGYAGHLLQTCTQCGLHIHELCACLIPTNVHDPKFVCLACSYVGKEVEVNVPSRVGGCEFMGVPVEPVEEPPKEDGDEDEDGERKENGGGKKENKESQVSKKRWQCYDTLVQHERPHECVLCSVATGIHAMHPLYDTHGPKGRQLVLPASGQFPNKKERRLAWVHTLCAQFIGRYKRLHGVFGCYENGEYEEEDVGVAEGSVSGGGDEERKNEYFSSDDEGKPEYVGVFKRNAKVKKYFRDEDDGEMFPLDGKVKKFLEEKNEYRIIYKDGDYEELAEEQVREILVKDSEAKESEDKKDESENISDADDTDVKSNLQPTHHWVFNTASAKQIFDHRNDLQCTICKRRDNARGSCYRLAVQCAAYDKHQFQEFKKHFPRDGVTDTGGEVQNDDDVDLRCHIAVHVGCARWASKNYAKHNGRRVRMCYFWPGQKADFVEDEHKEMHVEDMRDCYCLKDAIHLLEGMAKAHEAKMAGVEYVPTMTENAKVAFDYHKKKEKKLEEKRRIEEESRHVESSEEEEAEEEETTHRAEDEKAADEADSSPSKKKRRKIVPDDGDY